MAGVLTHTGRFTGLGRGGGIRTRDPLHPMQVRYQAALHAEAFNYMTILQEYWAFAVEN